MGQEMVEAILTIEQEAAEQQARVQKQADTIIAEATNGAEELLARVKAAAQKEADSILTEGKRIAETEQSRILDEARQEAEQLEHTAQGRLEEAVAYVVRRVSGRD